MQKRGRKQGMRGDEGKERDIKKEKCKSEGHQTVRVTIFLGE